MTLSDFLRVTLLGVLGWVGQGVAQPAMENSAGVQARAHAFVLQQLESQFGASKMAQDIEFTLGPVDARWGLVKCAGEPALAFIRTPIAAGLTQLKISCNAPVQWAFTLPVRVVLYGQVAVAARTLGRGERLQISDIRWQRVNLAQAGPNTVDALTRWQGYEIKRPVQEGDLLRTGSFALPHLIRTGDQISLEAEAAGFQVNTSATALTDGQLGGSIRVKNNRTQRIVTAFVVAPGRAQVQTFSTVNDKKS